VTSEDHRRLYTRLRCLCIKLNIQQIYVMYVVN